MTARDTGKPDSPDWSSGAEQGQELPPAASAWAYPSGPPGWRPTNQLAIASLICACAQAFLWILTGIPAIVLGHIARRQIRRTGENGDGLALAGLIIGYAGSILAVIAVIVLIGIIVSSRTVDYGFSGKTGP